MITKEAQCKIITDYLNASGIVNQFLNDTIMDALDEIETRNVNPIVDRRTETIIIIIFSIMIEIVWIL